MMEAMFVMFLAGMLSFSALSPKPSLSLFFKRLEHEIVQEQLTAMSARQVRHIQVQSDRLTMMGREYKFPEGTVCEPFSWHYTPQGTISMGGAFSCFQQGQSGKVILRLGAGRIRFET
jgi:hypothetical protein